MQLVDCIQGERSWWAARLGIPTASEFDKIVTPARLDPSSQVKGYANKLLAEWLRGQPDDSFQSDWMKRGHEVEAEAISAYGLIKDCDPERVGFCLTDCGRYGASPDSLIGDDGGLEVKCPSPGVHVGYLLDGKLPTTYRVQVIGSLLVTGREWWDFESYHPDMEPLIVRTWRKE